MKKTGTRRNSILDHYKAHHEMGRPLLQWIGAVGCIAFPLLYVLRRATTDTGFDDLPLRMLAVVACLGLALRQWWPTRLKPFYIAYSWWVVFYCLSFFLAYTMLRNGGGTPFVVNMVMGAVLIVLLADWRNTVLILLLGWLGALSAYFCGDSHPAVPADFVFAVAGSLLLVTGGALSQKGQQRVELERMRRLYASLAGSIAHEMRTPLAQVQHALRRIETDVRPGSEAARAASQAHAAIQRGLQSISITLQQVGQSRPAVELRVLSAEQSALKALDEFAYDSSAARERVRLEVNGDFSFPGDQTAFELVMFNLLKNALYNLPLYPDMEVRVSVNGRAPAPCIVVRDSGPGIAPDVMPRLFEEFHTAGKPGGTGLGLSFCRRILRDWGGDIECRSEPGRFTEFTLRFAPAPAETGRTSPAHLQGPPARSLGGNTVLIVDDQRLNRTIARALIREMGMNVIEAEHGQQALDMLQAGTLPDVVLMDVNMPGLDGMATTQRIRTLPCSAARVPVFALTANDSPTVQAAAREAGMQGVLGKPIEMEALKHALAGAAHGNAVQTSSHSFRV